MNCHQCKKQYDQKFNTPRLLILCGHSICESCCYRLHAHNKIQCPECHAHTFIQTVSLLPKNLALIMTKMSSEILCEKHNKKYEAFCQKESILICIECILQDHKNHDMDSIKNSHSKQSEKWMRKMDTLERFMEKLHEGSVQNITNKKQSKENFVNAKETITAFFKQIRDSIDKEEENILQKFRQSYNACQSKFEEKNKFYQTSIENVEECLNKLKQYENSDELSFLDTVTIREQIYLAVKIQNQQPQKTNQITFSKKNILQNIIKNLEPLKMDKSAFLKNQNNAVSNYSSVSSSYAANNAKKNSSQVIIPSVKAVRKAPVASQNNSNPSSKLIPKKISTKKDISSNLMLAQQTTNVIPSFSHKNSLQNPLRQNRYECNPYESAQISAVDPKQSLCHSFMSNMTSFFNDNKRSIYLIGGFNQEANNIMKMNLSNHSFEDVSALNSNRSKFGSIIFERQVYLFGGKKGKERVGDIQIYNSALNKWNKSHQMIKNKSGFGVAQIGDIIYFIGGNDGENILNTVETLNIRNGQWRRKQSMTQSRDQLAVVVGKNNKIYAIGGFGGKDSKETQHPLKSVEVFDIKTQKWKTIPSMNHARRALAGAVLADGVYAIGGFDGSSYMCSVERYEEGDDSWSEVTSMKQSRCTHTAVSIYQCQQIYVFGGFDYVPLNTVERYSVITNQWETICTMPTPRFMHSSLLVRED